MYISFYIDQDFYSGTATLQEKAKEVQYLVDLNDSNKEPLQFVLCMSGVDGEWSSDDAINADIARAAGAEIEQYDEGLKEEPLVPNTYYSTETTGGAKPVFKNGEITNEPDDVDEQSAQ